MSVVLDSTFLGGNNQVVHVINQLELTEEEAFKLLELCMTSPQALDATAEVALKKLAQYCSAHAERLARRPETA